MMPDLSRLSLGELPVIDDEVIDNALDRLLAGPGARTWQNYRRPTPVFEPGEPFE